MNATMVRRLVNFAISETRAADDTEHLAERVISTIYTSLPRLTRQILAAKLAEWELLHGKDRP